MNGKRREGALGLGSQVYISLEIGRCPGMCLAR